MATSEWVPAWRSVSDTSEIDIGGVKYRPVVPFTIEASVARGQVVTFDDAPARVTLPDGRVEVCLSSWRLASIDAAIALGLLEPVETERKD